MNKFAQIGICVTQWFKFFIQISYLIGSKYIIKNLAILKKKKKKKKKKNK